MQPEMFNTTFFRHKPHLSEIMVNNFSTDRTIRMLSNDTGGRSAITSWCVYIIIET